MKHIKISTIKVFNFTFMLFLLLFLVACSTDETVEHKLTETELLAPTPRTISLNVAMPYEESGAKTRVSLSETDEGNISVTWKAGDSINLCFVSEDGTIVKTTSNVAVSNISEDGKRASFDVDIPHEISGTFNLYGLYGASFVSANSTTVLLPTISEGVELSNNEKVCVMRFAAENITETTAPQVLFHHIGSIIALWIKNETASDMPVKYFNVGSSYVGSTAPFVDWLNNISGQATYDIKNSSFVDAKPGATIRFAPPANTYISPQSMVKFYHWISPIDSVDMSVQPEHIYTEYFDGDIYRVVEMPAKTLLPGKYYRINLVFDGNLKYRKPVSESDLVSHWTFDGDANDAVGANNGTVYGNVTFTTDRHGNANSAYQFGGNKGDYIKCISPGVVGTGARTISFWAKADALSASEQTIIVYGGTTSGYGARFEVSLATEELICDISWSNLGKKSTAITNNTWNFYTIVFTGGSNQTLSTGVKYYLNGKLLELNGRRTRSDYIDTKTNHPIYFGTLYNDGRWFKGAIDDVKIYNKAMSSAEVLNLYNKYD
jgi:hypothetical protein